MINAIKQFFAREESREGAHTHEKAELHIAAAAMLIEGAMMDGDVDEREREKIAAAIELQFGISRDDVRQIVAEGEERQKQAVDIYSFLRVVNEHFGYAERVELIEMLWEVCLADEELHDHEAALIRKLCGMLGVTDVDSGAARKRVEARMESTTTNGDALHPRL